MATMAPGDEAALAAWRAKFRTAAITRSAASSTPQSCPYYRQPSPCAFHRKCPSRYFHKRSSFSLKRAPNLGDIVNDLNGSRHAQSAPNDRRRLACSLHGARSDPGPRRLYPFLKPRTDPCPSAAIASEASLQASVKYTLGIVYFVPHKMHPYACGRAFFAFSRPSPPPRAALPSGSCCTPRAWPTRAARPGTRISRQCALTLSSSPVAWTEGSLHLPASGIRRRI